MLDVHEVIGSSPIPPTTPAALPRVAISPAAYAPDNDPRHCRSCGRSVYCAHRAGAVDIA